MFRSIQPLTNLDPNKLTMNQALRLFMTRKKFCVLTPSGGFHLVNDPKRLVMDKYRIEDTYDIEIYEV